MPSESIFDLPVTSVPINQTWLAHITGAIENLSQSSKWLGDETQVQTAIDELQRLIDALQGV